MSDDLIKSAAMNRWSNSGPAYWAGADTKEKIEPGMYNIVLQEGVGPVFIKTDIVSDALIEFPNSHSEDILKEIRTFWTLREAFSQRNLTFKRGILLHGPTGSGKTSIVNLLGNALVKEHNGIVVQSYSAQATARSLQLLRRIEPDRPVAIVIEDFDAQLHHDESGYLALLDGELQIDNLISIATTNYLDRIAERFWNRPSRFDLVVKVDLPEYSVRALYLKSVEPSFKEEEIEEIASKTEGLSFAHLRELIILVKCFNKPLEEALERLKRMKEHPPSGDYNPVGFLKGKKA